MVTHIFRGIVDRPRIVLTILVSGDQIYVAPSGNSTSPCGLGPSNPCIGLESGVINAKAGDILLLEAGLYNITLVQISFNLSIQSVDNRAPIISCVTQDWSSGIIADGQLSAMQLRLENLVFVNCGSAVSISRNASLIASNLLFEYNTGENSPLFINEHSLGGHMIVNCSFNRNYMASSTSAVGGGLYLERPGTCLNCSFTNNVVSGEYAVGGAVAILTGASGSSFINCLFANNSAIGMAEEGQAFALGGAVYVVGIIETDRLRLSFENCTFLSNSASVMSLGSAVGGALSANGICSVQLSHCDFIDNRATMFGPLHFNITGVPTHPMGGALWCMDSFDISYCHFNSNYVSGGEVNFAGALAFVHINGRGYVSNSLFFNNSALGRDASLIHPASSGYGGAVYGVLPPYLSSNSNATTFVNTTFLLNSCRGGDGVVPVRKDQAHLTDGAPANGGAVGSWFAPISFDGCTFDSNSAHGGSGADSDIIFPGGDGATSIGGAIWSIAPLDIRRSQFVHNKAVGGDGGDGGSGSNGSFSDWTYVFQGTVFRFGGSSSAGGSAADGGSGGYGLGGAVFAVMTISISEVEFLENEVLGGTGGVGGTGGSGVIPSQNAPDPSNGGNGGNGGMGGPAVAAALAVSSSSQVTISGTNFTSNVALTGASGLGGPPGSSGTIGFLPAPAAGTQPSAPASIAGAVFFFTANSTSLPLFSGCAFFNNSADHGGGVYVSVWSSVDLESCIFSANSAHYGGGLYLNEYAETFSASSLHFSNNDASIAGGAIFTSDTDSSFPSLTHLCANISGNNSAGYGPECASGKLSFSVFSRSSIFIA